MSKRPGTSYQTEVHFAVVNHLYHKLSLQVELYSLRKGTHTVVEGVVRVMRGHLSHRYHHRLVRGLLYEHRLHARMTEASRGNEVHSRRGGLMYKLRGHVLSKERLASGSAGVDVACCCIQVLVSYT